MLFHRFQSVAIEVSMIFQSLWRFQGLFWGEGGAGWGSFDNFEDFGGNSIIWCVCVWGGGGVSGILLGAF